MTPEMISAVGKGTEAVTDLAGLAFDVWEYYETKKEMARLEEKEDALRERAEGKEEKRYQTSLAMARTATREDKRRYEMEWKDAQEQKQYSRGREAVGQFLSTLAQKPALENRMMQIWPTRRYF